jgi:hypothetical protein
MDHEQDKGKEIWKEKKKDPMWIGGMELIDLSDCKVPNKKLQCDNEDTNDKEVPNPDGMDVGEGARSCLQIV